MSVRAIASIASILGLLVTAVLSQQPALTGNAPASNTAPPLFQGIMVDAKEKTVGRIYIDTLLDGSTGNSSNVVIRQINRIWVALPVADLSGFTTIPTSECFYYFQSGDCTGPALMYVNPNTATSLPNVTVPPLAIVTTIPPANTPSIYFAGTPSVVTANSARNPSGGNCFSYNNGFVYMGSIQSVPVSNLGLTLPFSVK
jgi:hypothetical protein